MLKMTYKLAHAAGTDAANRNMRSEGRKVWNAEDAEIAAATLNRLYPVEVELALLPRESNRTLSLLQ